MNKDSTISITTLPGGATAPVGFRAGGVRGSGGLDVGLLVSERPCDAAAVFTRNAFKGAPLGVTREAVEAGGLRAVVVNSRNAHPRTGARGVGGVRAEPGGGGGGRAGRVGGGRSWSTAAAPARRPGRGASRTPARCSGRWARLWGSEPG